MKSSEFARRQGVDQKTVRRWFAAGKLNARKVSPKTILVDDANPFREQPARQELPFHEIAVMAEVDNPVQGQDRPSAEVDRRLNELERWVGQNERAAALPAQDWPHAEMDRRLVKLEQRVMQNERETALPARDRPQTEMSRRLVELERRVQQDEKDAAIVQNMFLALVIIIVLLMAVVLARLIWR